MDWMELIKPAIISVQSVLIDLRARICRETLCGV